MFISLQNLPHMQLAISLSFVKLLWPLVRFISYSHDQDHVHVSTTCYASRLEVSKHPSIHKIKLHVHVWHHSLSKIYQGYGAMQKENKKMHTQRRYATCLGMSKKKKKKRKKIAPYPKRKKRRERERWCIQRSSYTIHQKHIHTLAHLDQGLWLVSPLDPVFDLAKYEKQVCLYTLHTYSSTKKEP